MTADDRGLRAVARVRGVRERDSAQGLQQAGRVVDERLRELDDRQQQLESAPAFTVGPAGGFLLARSQLSSMADAATRAAADVQRGRLVADEALGRWQHDRSRLRAVELLAARRAQQERSDDLRAEGRHLDEVAGRRWVRSQQAGEGT